MKEQMNKVFYLNFEIKAYGQFSPSKAHKNVKNIKKSYISCCNSNKAQYIGFMAGVAGFEPTNVRVRVWCLTAWRYPNKNGGRRWSRTIEPVGTDLQSAAFGHFAILPQSFCANKWWMLQGSNLWPPPCKGDALPAELNIRFSVLYNISIIVCLVNKFIKKNYVIK